jgi:hypothetical protein
MASGDILSAVGIHTRQSCKTTVRSRDRIVRIRLSEPQLIQLKYFSIVCPLIPQVPLPEFC